MAASFKMAKLDFYTLKGQLAAYFRKISVNNLKFCSWFYIYIRYYNYFFCPQQTNDYMAGYSCWIFYFIFRICHCISSTASYLFWIWLQPGAFLSILPFLILVGGVGLSSVNEKIAKVVYFILSNDISLMYLAGGILILGISYLISLACYKKP